MTRPAAQGSDVTVTLACDNRCVFCPRSTLRHVSLERPADLADRLDDLRARSDRVVLTGGEVTLLPEAIELVDLCRRRGFRQIGLITNGRRLSDPGLAAGLVDAGLTDVCVTVYDLRAEVHDGLTSVPGSLAETLAGLGSVLALAREAPGSAGLAVRVATVACAANADGLAAMVGSLAARGVRRFLVADAILGDRYDEPLDRARIRAIAGEVAADGRVSRDAVVWRGFPACVWGDHPSVRWEPHHIETADADPTKLNTYLAAFRSHFVHAAACGRCALRDECPGIQRRSLDCIGADDLLPLTRRPEGMDPARGDELAPFDRWRDPGRLAVTPTVACQMRCTYCGVTLGGQHAAPEVLDRSVDLLLTSRRRELELQFFGGEPLLRRDEVERTMERGTRLARQGGKRILYTVTTNGLLLDRSFLELAGVHEMRVLFSMDGGRGVMARQRPLATPRPGACGTIEENLGGLIESGVSYFVNLVAVPEDLDGLVDRVRHLAGLGVETVQLCYATGPRWPAAAAREFCDVLVRCARLTEELARRGRTLVIQNLSSRAEPTILSNDLLVDVDGTLYGDAAIFAERALPGLRDAYRIGHVADLKAFDGVRRSRDENLAILRRTYPEGSEVRRRVEEHLRLGSLVQRTVDGIGGGGAGGKKPSSVRDSNPLRRRVIGADLPDQARWMRRRPDIFKLPLLALQNPCSHDCIFCIQKELEVTDIEGVERWFDDNQRTGFTRLGLVGNEPLAHPEIDRVLRSARLLGFERIEALTSAAPLAEPDRLEALVAAGVRGYAIPLFAADAAVHDRIVRADGSHRQTLHAVDRLRELGATVHIHANVLRQNLDQLDALERLVVDDLGLPLSLIPVRPKRANLPYRDLVPRYRDMIERLHVRSLVAFPRCVSALIQGDVTPDASRISDLLKVYLLDQPFLKPGRCRACDWRTRCTGTFAAYLEIHGDGELTVHGSGE